jgi:hypothetical protein
MKDVLQCSNDECPRKYGCYRYTELMEKRRFAMYFEALGNEQCKYFLPIQDLEDR